MLTVALRGLELHGRHGVLEEERQQGQRFRFDVELELPELPAETDRLADAADYREIAAAVREVSDGRRFQLLEALAAAVADELVARFGAERVRVRVDKPDVALDPPVAAASVSVERARVPGSSRG